MNNSIPDRTTTTAPNPDDDDLLEREIVALLEQDCELLLKHAQAQVPPAELVWLRAEMRAREEAARKATRPIVIGQAIGIAACAGLLIALLGRLSLSQLPAVPTLVLAMVVGSWLVLAPLAVYLAFAGD